MCFLASDAEDTRADDGAEAEPDEIKPCKASAHFVFTLFLELDEFGGVGGAAKDAVLEAWACLGEGRLVGSDVLERGFGEEVLFAETPVGFWGCRRW